MRFTILLFLVFSTPICYGQPNEAGQDSLNIKEAESYRNLAADYRSNNSYDSAMVYAIKALRINEAINDSLAIFNSLHQIGMINILFENYDDAENAFVKASPIAFALKDTNSLISNFHHLGLVHQKKHEFEIAFPNYEKAIALCMAFGDYLGAAILNGNIGSSYMDQQNFSASLPYLNKALSLKKNHGAPIPSICHTLLDLCELNLYTTDYNRASLYADSVIDLARSHEEYNYLQYAYLFKSEASHETGENTAAYDYLMKHVLLKDSLFNEAKAAQVQELQIAYASEKKDNEIRSLEQAKEIERSRKQLYLIIGLSILIIGIGVYVQLQQKSKRNKLLLDKEMEVDRLKSKFFNNISHEFRTPLSLILGPIQTRIDKEKDPDSLLELKMMERNALRLQKLINDILDIAKSEEGKLELIETRFNINEVLKGMFSSFSSLAESNKINFTYSMSELDEDFLVKMDKEKLETILINLLSNAFKFTEKGGEIDFSAELIKENENEGILYCSVRDNGQGIPHDKLSHIFDRFYQVDDSNSRKKEGTGIGLAFTKELCSLMGGEIKAESKVGEGATFKFSLPYSYLKNEMASHDQSIDESFSDKRDYVIPKKKIKIEEDEKSELPLLLLVEDSEDLSTYISSLLINDYRIRIAFNGKEGLEIALEEIPDLIISDIMMPLMDGYELCKEIKTNIATSHIPVILLSAKSSAESRIAGLETEADVYMSKPFNPKELQLQVRNIIQNHTKTKEKYLASDVLIPIEEKNNTIEQQFLDKLGVLMNENHQNPEYSVEQLSADIGLSRSQLYRKLQALTNTSTSKFIRVYRLKKAMILLKEKSASISEIAYDVGFNNVSYFNKCFLETFGYTPGEV